MSENEYVATAAAEKRLREVLADRLPEFDGGGVELVAVALLDGAKIEYKPRTKTVLISLDLPDTATTRKPKAVTETADGSEPLATELGPEHSDGYALPGERTEQTPPQPHIAPFTPVLDPDAEYDDIHYD